MNNKYEDIINMPHHISKKHPQMSMEARAAQFAPFSALTGYEQQVKETARLTNKKIELNEEAKEILDIKLQELQKQIPLKPKISFTYFVQDEKKTGGKYITTYGSIKKIDEYKQLIILEDLTKIPIADIIDIS